MRTGELRLPLYVFSSLLRSSCPHESQGTGIFIVKPDFSDPSPNITPVQNNPSNEKPENEQGQRENEITHPRVEIMRIPTLANRSCLDRVSCLQMTDTGLFLNWDPYMLSDDGDEDDEDLFHSSLRDEPHYAGAVSPIFVVNPERI